MACAPATEQAGWGGGGGLAVAEKEYLTGQIAQLRVQLAHKGSELSRVEAALAEATAASTAAAGMASPTAAATARQSAVADQLDGSGSGRAGAAAAGTPLSDSGKAGVAAVGTAGSLRSQLAAANIAMEEARQMAVVMLQCILTAAGEMDARGVGAVRQLGLHQALEHLAEQVQRQQRQQQLWQQELEARQHLQGHCQGSEQQQCAQHPGQISQQQEDDGLPTQASAADAPAEASGTASEAAARVSSLAAERDALLQQLEGTRCQLEAAAAARDDWAGRAAALYEAQQQCSSQVGCGG